MTVDVTVTAAGAFVLSAALTGLMQRFATRLGLVDVPNERSSHSVVTPRGGGVAIVVVSTLAAWVLYRLGDVESRLPVVLAGGLAVAAIGFLDDRRSLSAVMRIIVHVVAAIWAVSCLGGFPELMVGRRLVDLGRLGDVFAVLGIVSALNLFNFMDGIDGIAASEAIFVAGSGAALALFGKFSGDVGIVGAVFAAACCGFLVWNWPPAKIFMGDAGSGYLGYVTAALGLAAARTNPVAVWVWVVLGGFFFMDAAVTLARRLARGERVYEAHRSHAYQHLARRWSSHLKVTLMVAGVNVAWLLPCAVLAIEYPQMGALITFAALAPVAWLVFAAGAGRGERR